MHACVLASERVSGQLSVAIDIGWAGVKPILPGRMDQLSHVSNARMLLLLLRALMLTMLIIIRTMRAEQWGREGGGSKRRITEARK